MKFKALNSVERRQIIPLFLHTFSQSEGEEEGQLIGQLVDNFLNYTQSKDLRAYFLEINNELIAGAFYTRIQFEKSPISAFLMAPVAVHPEYQGKGLGQKLIHQSHDALRKEGAELCLSYGDIQFYSKVGYQVISEELIAAPLPLSYPEGWIACMLDGGNIPKIAGSSFCVDEINDPRYW